MRREKSIDLLFNSKIDNVNQVKNLIQQFSAYLDKYNHDFKYNYKYLPSHVDDFMTTVCSLNHFESDVNRIVEILLSDSDMNKKLTSIMLNSSKVKLTVTLNSSISLTTESGAEEGLIKDKNNVLDRASIRGISEGKMNYLYLDIEMLYKEKVFMSNYYDLKVNEVKKAIEDFIDECGIDLSGGKE